MNDAKLVTIDDICDFIGGSQPEKSTFISTYKEGYIRLIQTRDYKTDKFITFIPINEAKRFCTEEDIIIGRYGPPIFQIFRGLKGAYNVALMKAVPKANMLNDYLYYLLKQDDIFQYVDSLSLRTGGQTGVDLDSLKKYPVLLPDLKYQQKVVNILKSIDDKIKLNNRINQELENLIKNIYDYWFVQFEFKNENGKPYKSAGGKMVWNADLNGEIPEKWEIRELKEFCLYNQESFTGLDNWDFINYLDTSNITRNEINQINKLDCQTEKLPSRAKRKVSENAILFSTVRPNQEHHGLIKKAFKNMLVSTGFVVITHKDNAKFNDLIYAFLTQEWVENKLQTIANTSTSSYPSIIADDILNLKMILPQDIKVLERLSGEFNLLYEMISENYSQTKELIKLRDWLIPMLMNGQVTFKIEKYTK